MVAFVVRKTVLPIHYSFDGDICVVRFSGRHRLRLDSSWDVALVQTDVWASYQRFHFGWGLAFVF